MFSIRRFSVDRRFRHQTKLDTSRIPYAVSRSASGNLPIYTTYRGVNRDPTTYVGSIFGDMAAFKSDLKMVVCNSADIKESGRTVEIKGRFAQPLKKWLQSLGF